MVSYYLDLDLLHSIAEMKAYQDSYNPKSKIQNPKWYQRVGCDRILEPFSQTLCSLTAVALLYRCK
ncbi:MAG TPA: hypothetical protein V6C91_10540 [Coleofasciculaceae cyanobacterium]